jgi:CubicO group peptidase (beta-lactamase class C family)
MAVNVRELGFDEARLARAQLESDIATERCHGAQLIIARHGQIVLEQTLGHADRAANKQLTADSVFTSLSVGKQFTGVLILGLVERGALSLSAPVASVIPEFGKLGKERVTLYQLLTQTSGLQSAIPSVSPDVLMNIEKLTDYACRSALESLPGARVNYSIALAHSVMAAMALRVAGGGRSFARMLAEDLFQRAELPAGGFLTTVRDMHRFAEMLRRGGELDGARVLSPATIDYATHNQTGDRPNELWNYTTGFRGWDVFPAYLGIGFFLRGEKPTPGPFGALNSARTFGGIGAGSTAFWVDPARELTFAFASTGLMEDSFHLERVARLSDQVVSSIAA